MLLIGEMWNNHCLFSTVSSQEKMLYSFNVGMGKSLFLIWSNKRGQYQPINIQNWSCG